MLRYQSSKLGRLFKSYTRHGLSVSLSDDSSLHVAIVRKFTKPYAGGFLAAYMRAVAFSHALWLSSSNPHGGFIAIVPTGDDFPRLYLIYEFINS